MGQYHILVNFTKREYVHPHRLGNGAKLLENVGFDTSLSTALFMLMAVSNGRGGGDFRAAADYNVAAKKRRMIGSWGGDRVAVIGDYFEKKDLPADLIDEPDVYKHVLETFKDISGDIRKMFALEFGTKYKNEVMKVRMLSGKVERHPHWSYVTDEKPPLCPDMIITTRK